MVTFNIAKLSSKGQIVIPSEMRKDFKTGDELLIIKDDQRIILKKANQLTEQMKEDLEFAQRTEQAWQRIEKGEFIEMPADEFLQELQKW